jgi:hypothetical protein
MQWVDFFPEEMPLRGMECTLREFLFFFVETLGKSKKRRYQRPAAAVIPAVIAYFKVVAVKTLVVGL